MHVSAIGADSESNSHYAQTKAKYGTANIPINTFNKVWIVPDKAVVYENSGTAFVLENHLKVMLEEDYLSLSRHSERSEESKGALRSFVAKTAPQDDKGVNALGSPLALRNDVASIGTNIVREIVIPELTKEVNLNKNFSQLRQVYNSLI